MPDTLPPSPPATAIDVPPRPSATRPVPTGPGVPDGPEFDAWLRGQLDILERAVLTEPVPERLLATLRRC